MIQILDKLVSKQVHHSCGSKMSWKVILSQNDGKQTASLCLGGQLPEFYLIALSCFLLSAMSESTGRYVIQ